MRRWHEVEHERFVAKQRGEMFDSPYQELMDLHLLFGEYADDLEDEVLAEQVLSVAAFLLSNFLLLISRVAALLFAVALELLEPIVFELEPDALPPPEPPLKKLPNIQPLGS